MQRHAVCHAVERQGQQDVERHAGRGLSEVISNSHARSATFGLSVTMRPDYGVLPPADLALKLEQNRALFVHARPVMETLYAQIVNTHSMIALTDASGLILHSLGDDDFLARAEKVALRAGAVWSEARQGTNAIGTAIAEREATTIHGDQHYLRANQFSHLLERADPRSARQPERRARRDRRQAQLPSAHDGAREDVRADDREPADHEHLHRGAAHSFPQPARIHRHADGRDRGFLARRTPALREPQRAVPAWPRARRSARADTRVALRRVGRRNDRAPGREAARARIAQRRRRLCERRVSAARAGAFARHARDSRVEPARSVDGRPAVRRRDRARAQGDRQEHPGSDQAAKRARARTCSRMRSIAIRRAMLGRSSR